MFRKLAPIEALSLGKTSSQNRLQGSFLKDSGSLANGEELKDSRISSFASVRSDGGYLAGKNEKMGIKRFARACMQWNSDSFNSDGIYGEKEEAHQLDNRAIGSRDSTFLENEYRKVSLIDKIHEHDMEINRLRKLQLGCSESKGESFRKQYRKALGKTKPSLDNIAKGSEKDATTVSKSSMRKPLSSLHSKRVVVVSNIPKSCGPTGVLCQVCGGPLERIVFHEHKDEFLFELHFIFPEHAKRFHTYGSKTGLLVLNGVHLNVEWANSSNTSDLDHYHPPVSKYLLHEINHYGARRCLIFSKVVPNKSTKHSHVMHYPSPKTHLSKDFFIEQIKEDFAAFGGILDVASVISRKLCFSLHFFDIRAAIIAKRECETEGTTMYSRYNQWSIWYGKDPTDKPCISL